MARTLLARRNLMVAALALVVAFPAAATDVSAKRFLEAIYAHYRLKDRRGLPDDPRRKGLFSDLRRAELDRWFAPGLARAIWNDRHAGEMPLAQGDLFVGLLWPWAEFDAITIEVKDIDPSHATAVVTIKGRDSPGKQRLKLVMLKQGWRISDIARGPTGSLYRYLETQGR